MKVYAKHGIKHLWLIDPYNETFEVYELDRKKTYRLIASLAGEEELSASIFPNLIIPLKEIW